MAAENDKVEHDLGMPEMEDGQPTLEEITLEGVPNIRMIVSDVLLDSEYFFSLIIYIVSSTGLSIIAVTLLWVPSIR